LITYFVKTHTQMPKALGNFCFVNIQNFC